MRNTYSNADITLVSRSGQVHPQTNRTCKTLLEGLTHKPDFAIVASTANLHLEDALQLAQSGVPMLIEKPLSYNEKGIEHLIQICREQSVVAVVGYNLRFHDVIQQLRSILQDEPVGKIMRVQVEASSYLPQWRPLDGHGHVQDYRRTASAQKKTGGGCVLELSHELDYLMHLFGNLEVLSSALFHREGLDVEDLMHGQVWASVGQFPISMTFDFFRRDTVRVLEIIGKTGTLRADLVKNTLDLYDFNGAELETRLFHRNSDPHSYYERQFSAFMQAITEGKLHGLVSLLEAQAVMALIDELKRGALSLVNT